MILEFPNHCLIAPSQLHRIQLHKVTFKNTTNAFLFKKLSSVAASFHPADLSNFTIQCWNMILKAVGKRRDKKNNNNKKSPKAFQGINRRTCHSIFLKNISSISVTNLWLVLVEVWAPYEVLRLHYATCINKSNWNLFMHKLSIFTQKIRIFHVYQKS